jgi:hypothetical protein
VIPDVQETLCEKAADSSSPGSLPLPFRPLPRSGSGTLEGIACGFTGERWSASNPPTRRRTSPSLHPGFSGALKLAGFSPKFVVFPRFLRKLFNLFNEHPGFSSIIRISYYFFFLNFAPMIALIILKP